MSAKPIRQTPSIEESWTNGDDIRSLPFNFGAKDSGEFVEFIGLASLG